VPGRLRPSATPGTVGAGAQAALGLAAAERPRAALAAHARTAATSSQRAMLTQTRRAVGG
jgi:hypothetical protein